MYGGGGEIAVRVGAASVSTYVKNATPRLRFPHTQFKPSAEISIAYERRKLKMVNTSVAIDAAASVKTKARFKYLAIGQHLL